MKTAWGSSFNSRLHIVNRGRSGESTLPDPSSAFVMSEKHNASAELSLYHEDWATTKTRSARLVPVAPIISN